MLVHQRNSFFQQKEVLVFLAAILLLFAGIGLSPIYILDEARNAQCAREMMMRNDWIVPTFNGELRVQKPPLHYYFMRMGYLLFGVNEFGARFFSALFGVATLFITWLAAKKYLQRSIAFLAIGFLTASVHFLFEFNLAVPDPYLIFFITAFVLSFFVFTQNGNWLWILLASVSASLAVLTKGPVAIALPGLSMLIWLLWERSLKKIWNLKIVIAGLLFILITVPWYWLVHKATNGQFTREFFFTQNLSRFSEPMEGHGGIFIIVILFVLLGMLPGSAFTGYAFQKKIRKEMPSLIKLSMIVTIVFVAFFSVSKTKLPNYPMPCYPFFALVIAYGIHELYQSGVQIKKYIFWILLVISFLIPTGAWIAIHLEPALQGREYYAFFLLILPLGILVLFLRQRKMSVKQTIHFLFIIYYAFNFLFLVVIYPRVYQQNPVAKTIHLLQEQKQVYAYDTYNPGYNFYLPGNVKVITQASELYQVMKTTPGLLIISRKNLYEQLDTAQLTLVEAHRDLFELPETVLFKLK